MFAPLKRNIGGNGIESSSWKRRIKLIKAVDCEYNDMKDLDKRMNIHF